MVKSRRIFRFQFPLSNHATAHMIWVRIIVSQSGVRLLFNTFCSLQFTVEPN